MPGQRNGAGAVTGIDPTATTTLPPTAVIAIDGPAGSGKSTTAKALAELYDLLYIDTGAMYRALTLAALQQNIACTNGEALTDLLCRAQLELRPGKPEVQVLWNGKDVSQEIRRPEVDAAVSAAAAHQDVRELMVARQQELGRRGGVVMEGRDIGSVVFPLATAKIFLTASLTDRVERRYRQNKQRGLDASRDDLHRDLAERDRQDSSRDVSPLTVSPDAFVIDSSGMSLEQQNQACAEACLVNPRLDAQLDFDLGDIAWHYRLAYSVFCTLARFFGLRLYGRRGDALPRGCIVAANHISLWDPPLVGSTFRRFRVKSLAKAELFIGPLGSIFRWLDSIPIKRRGFDATAFTAAAEALQAGDNLLIFPEGTRRAIGHPGPVRNGLGILVQATGAPMLPIFIRGSYGRLPGGSQLSPLEVHWGPVIRWHGLEYLMKTLDKKEVSRRVAMVCEAAYWELQARSFARIPQTDFERELGEKQLLKFQKRQEKVFGTGR